MLTTVILTIFGADRPGLVEAVSACASKHGANWLESRMLHLGGCFAGIARLEVEDQARTGLLEAMKGLSEQGLQVVLHDAGAGSAGSVSGVPATLEIVGHDRPGIVREIARALSARAVNVEELSTERSSAPMTGELIFTARANVRLPPGMAAREVKRELEAIASDLMVDLDFRES
jgi:glycine cleavage system regulatory protein